MAKLAPEELVDRIRRIQSAICDRVVEHISHCTAEGLAEVVGEAAEDTLYAIDRVSEAFLREAFARELSADTSYVLVGEGLQDGGETYPEGTREEDAEYRVIVDPIDGTRGLMYDKRSAWILTGVAPNHGPGTTLGHMTAAVQTEIPTRKQYRADVLWAVRGQGARAEALNRLTGERSPLHLRPSGARTLEHGFASFVRFFPGGKEIVASVDEALIEVLIGPVVTGRARSFEDQYISTGGQLYELMAGHDRFVADLRPRLDAVLASRQQALGICCHPYDVCTELIAREMGVCVTDEEGRALDAPLDVTTPVAWVGYANEALRKEVEPELQRVLREHGLL